MTHMPGMLCPACKVDLVMAERQNIEIDYCPKCRGVWLDRGELDKIIEKSAREAEAATPAPQAAPMPQARPAERYEERRPEYRRDDWRRDDDDRRYHGGSHHKGYRRKSWLEEIFD